jgi:O-antigen/teichoic acid export membrane protein
LSVVKGLITGNAAYAVQTTVRLLATAVIARLITPEDMGIWTLGFAISLMFNIFRDFGTATFIQTTKILTPEHIRACNTLQLIIGIAFFVLFIGGAPYVAKFYNEPRVADVLYVLAFGLIILPFSSTNFNLLLRDGRFEVRTAIDFTGQMFIYLGSVFCAYFGAAHLSAPIAVVVSQLVIAIICVIVRNPDYATGYSTKAIKSVMNTSGSALGTSLLQLGSDRSADFVLPKTQGFGPASMYEKGVNSLELVRLAVIDLFGTVLLGSLRLRSEKEPDVFPILAADIFYVTFLLAGTGAALMAINAEAFILTLFGKQWVSAVDTLQILAFSTPFVCGSAFLTKIMFLRQMHGSAFKTAIFTRIGVILTVISLSHSSLKTLAVGVVIAEFSFFLLYANLNRQSLNWKSSITKLLIDLPLALTVLFGVHFLVEKYVPLKPHFSFLLNSLASLTILVLVFILLRKKSVHKIKNTLNLH